MTAAARHVPVHVHLLVPAPAYAPVLVSDEWMEDPKITADRIALVNAYCIVDGLIPDLARIVTSFLPRPVSEAFPVNVVLPVSHKRAGRIMRLDVAWNTTIQSFRCSVAIECALRAEALEFIVSSPVTDGADIGLPSFGHTACSERLSRFGVVPNALIHTHTSPPEASPVWALTALAVMGRRSRPAMRCMSVMRGYRPLPPLLFQQ